MQGLSRLAAIFEEMIKSWFDFGIFRLLSSINVEPSTALLVNEGVYDVDWHALEGHDWFRMLTIHDPLSKLKIQQRSVDAYRMPPRNELFAAISGLCMSTRSLTVP